MESTGSWKTDNHRMPLSHLSHNIRRKPTSPKVQYSVGGLPMVSTTSESEGTAVTQNSSTRHSSSSMEAVVEEPINHHPGPHFLPSFTSGSAQPQTQYMLNRGATAPLRQGRESVYPIPEVAPRSSNSSLKKKSSSSTQNSRLPPLFDLAVSPPRMADLQRPTPPRTNQPANSNRRQPSSTNVSTHRRESSARLKRDSDPGTEYAPSETSTRQESDPSVRVTRRRPSRTEDGRRRSSIISNRSSTSSIPRSSERSRSARASPAPIVESTSSSPLPPVPSTPPVPMEVLPAHSQSTFPTTNSSTAIRQSVMLPDNLPVPTPRPRKEIPAGRRRSSIFSISGRLKGKGKWYQFWKVFIPSKNT